MKTKFYSCGWMFLGVLMSISGPIMASEDLKKGIELFNKSDWFGAAPYLGRAADEGEVEAQQRMGYILWKGGEIEPAARYLKAASEKGDPVSQVYYYILLVDGFPNNQELLMEARSWLEAAARSNYPRAMTILARLLEKEDPAKAVALYREMIALGEVSAVKRLIEAHKKQELGLSKDEEEIARLKSLL